MPRRKPMTLWIRPEKRGKKVPMVFRNIPATVSEEWWMGSMISPILGRESCHRSIRPVSWRLLMSELSLVEVENRLHLVELGLEELRARVTGSVPPTPNWLDVVSGSMSDFPEESYRGIMAAGRAIVAGEADTPEDR